MKRITYNGKTQSVRKWSWELGYIDSGVVLGYRIRHWGIERAFETPLPAHGVTLNGQTKTVAQWARELGFRNSAGLVYRLKNWHDIDRALTQPRQVKKKRKS